DPVMLETVHGSGSSCRQTKAITNSPRHAGPHFSRAEANCICHLLMSVLWVLRRRWTRASVAYLKKITRTSAPISEPLHSQRKRRPGLNRVACPNQPNNHHNNPTQIIA